MKRIAILLSSLLLLLTGCGGNDANGSYEQITQVAAKDVPYLFVKSSVALNLS